MRMALAMDMNRGNVAKNDPYDIGSPEWVDRQLRQKYASSNSSRIRINMFGKYRWAYELHDDFSNEMLGLLDAKDS